MNLTPEQFNALLTRPAIKRANAASVNSSQSTSPITQRNPGNEPMATAIAQGINPAKFSVIVTSYRRRLLDEDNLVEKWHVDALRYAGILPSDAPDQAQIKVRQEKVASKEDECTVITIEPLNL